MRFNGLLKCQIVVVQLNVSSLQKAVRVCTYRKRAHEVQSKQTRAATYKTIVLARVCVMRARNTVTRITLPSSCMI